MKRLFALLCLLAALTAAPGCTSMSGGYVLQGKAIEGDYSTMTFVGVDDSQLGALPVAYANISVYRDAGEPNQRLVATGRTDGAGAIHIPINEFGTGWMEETWLIQVVKPGFETMEMPLSFPRDWRKHRLLVIMRAGMSTQPKSSNELWEEYERYRR